MPSNEDGTLVDHGFAGCPGRDPQPDPPPSAYTNGVVTPHAAFLAPALPAAGRGDGRPVPARGDPGRVREVGLRRLGQRRDRPRRPTATSRSTRA